MRKVALLSIILCVLWGCASFNKSYKLGTEAATNKNWDEAIKHFEKAVQEEPTNSVYRLALTRAKILGSYSHVFRARRLAADGKKEEALAEYQKALSFDPTNTAIAEEARLLTGEEREEKKPVETKIEPLVRLKVSDAKLHLNFVHDQVRLKSIFQALGKHAKINVLFDEQFKDIPFSVDLSERSFEQAVNSLCLATKNFYRVIDESTIIVVPDLPAKRIQYELNAIKTFYLSNIKAEDIQASLMQILRSQFKAPQIMVDKNLNSITVRDAPAVLELAEKLIRLWDKPRGEVVIDLEIMEVSRIKLRDFGVEFDQFLMGLAYSGGEENPPTETGWFDLSKINFTKKGNYQITLPTAFLKFLESDEDTKIVSQPRLRGIEGEEISYLVGDKIPIPRTSFTPFAAGGVAQQPITSFEYEDVGIDIKITPRIHFEKEITLELEMNVKSVGGTGIADIPIISTREVKNIIRLKDGETNLLAGLLKDEERISVKGIIGLKNIPVLGGLFSSTEKSVQQTDVIMTITPYIIRNIPISEDDLKPLWVDLSGTVFSSEEPGGIRSEMEVDATGLRRMQETRETEEEREGRNQLFLNPGNFEITTNREFRISVVLRSEEEIGQLSVNLSFNPSVVKLKEIQKGSIADQAGKEAPFLQNIDGSSGMCTIGFTSPEVSRGFRGSGRLATLVFDAVAEGESTISFSNVSANSPSGKPVSFETQDARVRVR
ncbi:MAG: cohesin domain-containing protein [Candidatus Aminicenantes bacterium]|nr:cohesin domain-containing protein [Candidatus Aminicenantes bacterium]MDH5383071.1 cohesin domain-containing protein [Candidatus Aminicenantes bacterium]MDH5742834.1 cohesin domain-containing protein [Candidatus Aminicenantes bacterium]